MPRLKDSKFGTFGDGTLKVCEAQERKITKIKYAAIRYGDRVVGIKRFWEAKVKSSEVSKLVAIPKGINISTLDIVIIGDTQYKVLQVQDKFDARPPEQLITLEESKIIFAQEKK